MVFISLYESYLRGELLMVEGGLCQFRHRRDGQITIHVLLSNKPGAAKRMLNQLLDRHPNRIVAKCPIEYESNAWYKRNGFHLIGTEGKINIWSMEL